MLMLTAKDVLLLPFVGSASCHPNHVSLGSYSSLYTPSISESPVPLISPAVQRSNPRGASAHRFQGDETGP